MGKIYLATRVEIQDFNKIKKLVDESRLGRAEVARRLILIGLKHVERPEDLIKM